jgi:hypothetical protein
MRRIVVEEGPRGLELREVMPQSLSEIMYALGYTQETPAHRRAPSAGYSRRPSTARRSPGARSGRLPKQQRVPLVWRNG